jgi:hypothetical protein
MTTREAALYDQALNTASITDDGFVTNCGATLLGFFGSSQFGPGEHVEHFSL